MQTFARFNPSWRVVVLSQRSAASLLGSLLPPHLASLRPRFHQSELVRAAVLLKCGGVYLDASTFFTSFGVLDRMYDEMLSSGHEMRAYTHPFHSSIICTWFLMAVPEAQFLRQWHALLSAYWATRSTVAIPVLKHPLFSHASRNATAALQRMGSHGYLMAYCALLSVQEFDEWRRGRWRRSVLVTEGERASPLNYSAIVSASCKSQTGRPHECIRATMYAPPLSRGHLDLHTALKSNPGPFQKLTHLTKPAFLPASGNFSLNDVPIGSLLGQLLRGDLASGV